MPEDRPRPDRGAGLAVGGAVVMVLCCIGHSLALGADLTGLAAVAGATGSLAVAAGVVLLGLGAWGLMRRSRRKRTCDRNGSGRVPESSTAP